MIEIEEVYPYLRVSSTADAIEFYKQAFNAEELFRLTEPSGRIGHAELKLGPGTLMLADASAEAQPPDPQSRGGPTFSIHLHVKNVDEAFAQAVRAGATVLRPLQDPFYGERSGALRDPFGHEWLLGGHLESLTSAEMQERYTALFTS